MVNLEQPSATSFTFLCIENQGWAWVRVKGQPAEAWTGHVIGGPMAPGLGGQGSPRSMTVGYLVEKLAEFWYGLLRGEKSDEK